MIIKCSNCGSRYRISDNLVADGSKRFKCKSCGTVLLVKPPAAAKTPAREKPSATKSPAVEAPQEQEQPAAEQGPPAVQSESTEKPPSPVVKEQDATEAETGQTDENIQSGGAQTEDDALTPEEIAARQQQDLQKKLEERRRQMEDEISGRLNKAALETLDVDVLTELAHQIQDIQGNHDFKLEKDSRLFTCIKCNTTFCLYPEDSRLCANCTDEVSLVRAKDILKQFGMFS